MGYGVWDVKENKVNLIGKKPENEVSQYQTEGQRGKMQGEEDRSRKVQKELEGRYD